MVHFAGVGGREEHLAEWCELSEQKNATWNKKLSETQYPSEIHEFWEEVKKKKANIGQRMSDAKRRLKDICDVAKKFSKEKKTKMKAEDLKTLQGVLPEGERILELLGNLEEEKLTEEDIKAFESSIKKINDAVVNAKEV